MRVSRPASWFLQAAKQSSKHPTAACRRSIHATSHRRQDGDSNGPRTPGTSSTGGEPRTNSTKPVTNEATEVQSSYDRRVKSSTWSPEDAKSALQKRKARAEGARELLQQGVKQIRRYTPEELEQLRHLYTPQQIEALLAAEEAISPEDVVAQGEIRTDPAGLAYLDDLASIDPVLDKLAQGPEIQYGTDLDGPGLGDTGSEKAGKSERGEEKRELTAAQKRLRDADEDPHLLRLSQQTGFTKEQIRKFKVKSLVIRRVVNQTRMGKIMSLYNLTIAGNGNGLLGIGEGKAAEGEDAQRQAMMNAIRNMKPVHRYENRTVYGEVEGKVGAVRVKLMPRAPGFGCRTQHLIFEMCRAAGISDLAARTSKSRNQMNVCKATWKALLSQKLPDEVALGRGKKMVDVRKVYFAGNV